MRFFRGPEHCRMCGDEFVESSYHDGFRRDGTLIVKAWKHCPRALDSRPDPWERFQRGSCTPPHALMCSVEIAEYRAHRPPRCRHRTMSSEGDACWAKDGTPITEHRTLVAA